MPEERVQKILAHAGYGSRRGCEKIIEAGRVSVNGEKIKLGDKADPHRDNILVDGRPIKIKEDLVYIILNKPRGVLSSSKRQGDRLTVIDLVPFQERIYPVGRLDIESEGLILLTNDGDLTYKLTHPKFEHEKEYRVLVAKHPDREQLEAWKRGIVLEDGFKTAPVQVRVEKPHGKGTWLRVIMKEGHKRQIRETARQLGLPIVKLIRIRLGTIRLGNLQPKQWRHLEKEEVKELMKTLSGKKRK